VPGCDGWGSRRRDNGFAEECVLRVHRASQFLPFCAHGMSVHRTGTGRERAEGQGEGGSGLPTRNAAELEKTNEEI
jgi:hypothetical protein